MTHPAYYNEIDPTVCQWLENLIKAGHIAPGHVDNRSISDVKPSDLVGYSQCHFFAGIGVWSYALRCAGWDDDRPVWTASCPCQPFSTAGKGSGFADERHLWPDFYHLVTQCKPDVIFGEQVASKDAESWIDLVQTDLEGLDYAFGAVPFPAASVGAPHIRDRLYWVADTAGDRQQWARSRGTAEEGLSPRPKCIGQLPDGLERQRIDGGMADSDDAGLEGRRAMRQRADQCAAGPDSVAGGMADTESAGRRERSSDALRSRERSGSEGMEQRVGHGGILDRLDAAGPTNGHWRDADWLFCRDGRWRPVEPGTFPLVNGATSRMVKLRAYGNCIVAPQAQIFIESYIELNN